MPVAHIHILEGRYDGGTAGRLLSDHPCEGLERRRRRGRADRPDDLVITLYETPGENISFGRGLAQRADISDKEKVAI